MRLSSGVAPMDMTSIQRFLGRLRGRGVHVPPQAWDREYDGGRWEHLEGLREISRYSVIVGYCRGLKPEAAILDVGCGEGILRRRLGAESYSDYVGIDVSQVAIARASADREGRARFLVANAEEFVPDRRFDLVVFNESLYYHNRPLEVAHRFSGFLEPDGLLVVSMLNTIRTTVIRRKLEREFVVVHRTRVRSDGLSWTCSVLAARRSA